MISPPWLAGALATLMLLVAAAAATRLFGSRLPHRRTQTHGDALQVLTGLAMAGVFDPRVNFLPAAAWQAIFAATVAWFLVRASRSRGKLRPRSEYSHAAVQAVECGVMTYMVWPAAAQSAAGHYQAGMPGMGQHPAAIAGNPALILVLTICTLGCTVWTIDQLTSRRRAATAVRSRASNVGRIHPADLGTARPGRQAVVAPANRDTGPDLAHRPAAWQKTAMGLAMSYMLITML